MYALIVRTLVETSQGYSLPRQWLAIRMLGVLVIYWLLFSKHKRFRLVSSCVLLGLWPAAALVSIWQPAPVAGLGAALVSDFISWAIYCAVWVTYLQKSERVRVTFEHTVKNVPGISHAPSSHKAREADTPTLNASDTGSIAANPRQHTSEGLEDRLYDRIAQELETNTVDKGVWTKAYAQAGGDDKQTRVVYIRTRFARLLAMENGRNDP